MLLEFIINRMPNDFLSTFWKSKVVFLASIKYLCVSWYCFGKAILPEQLVYLS